LGRYPSWLGLELLLRAPQNGADASVRHEGKAEAAAAGVGRLGGGTMSLKPVARRASRLRRAGHGAAVRVVLMNQEARPFA
jgi:hypothetical protein